MGDGEEEELATLMKEVEGGSRHSRSNDASGMVASTMG